jgi:glycosyltransferase involved in cell wall biosynthesis
MALPSVSVVMPTRGRRHLLPDVLAPLLADEAVGELVVVVDGDVDGSAELLERLAGEDPRLRPVVTVNRGENPARQAGVEHATGDIVLLVDDDVVAEAGLAAGHARHHAGSTDRVVVGYMPVDPPSSAAEVVAARLYSEAYESRCRDYERDPAAVLRNLWAGNVSLRRSACLELGLADDRYTAAYHADRHFGLRCLKSGLSGVFDRSLRARHLFRRTLSGLAADSRRQGAGLVQLHRLHADVLGPFTMESVLADLPPAAVPALRACRRPRAHRLAVSGLLGALAAAQGVGLLAIQDRPARLLRRIEMQHGALAEMKAQGALPPSGSSAAP